MTVEISGSLLYVNAETGKHVRCIVTPFTMPEGALWVDIVDGADARTHPGEAFDMAVDGDTGLVETEETR